MLYFSRKWQRHRSKRSGSADSSITSTPTSTRTNSPTTPASVSDSAFPIVATPRSLPAHSVLATEPSAPPLPSPDTTDSGDINDHSITGQTRHINILESSVLQDIDSDGNQDILADYYKQQLSSAASQAILVVPPQQEKNVLSMARRLTEYDKPLPPPPLPDAKLLSPPSSPAIGVLKGAGSRKRIDQAVFVAEVKNYHSE